MDIAYRHMIIVYRHMIIVYRHIIIVYCCIDIVTCLSLHSATFRATAHLALLHPDIALSSVLKTCYYISQKS